MEDDITLRVNGLSISGWDSIRITRGIERLPSDFDIALTERFPGEANALIVHPGDSCQVMIGSDLVITGYVDRFVPEYEAGRHSIRIMGRSKCCDLVDCSAEWPNSQISGSSALGIAQKLAQPYGISVASDVSGMPAIPQFNLMLGETAWEVIEQITRYSALLAYDMADGSLFLTRASTTQAASGFTEGQNVQEASAQFSMDQRFSDYVGVRLGLDVLGDTGNGGNISAEVTDPNTTRHRMRIIVCEQTLAGLNIAKQRVVWEMNRRAGHCKELRVKTDSWRDNGGSLWAPNTLVPVSLPGLKMPNETLLIGEVTYLRDDQSGTTCDLVLMPPDAFSPEPILLVPIEAGIPQA